jgi:hypothetical protein
MGTSVSPWRAEERARQWARARQKAPSQLRANQEAAARQWANHEAAWDILIAACSTCTDTLTYQVRWCRLTL